MGVDNPITLRAGVRVAVATAVIASGLVLNTVRANPALAAPAPPDSYATAVAADVPVSYWRLDELSGSTAADQHNVNQGTIVGGVTRGQPGVVGGNSAMSFDGSTGYVSLGDPQTLRPAPTYSLEAWFKTSASFGDRRVVLRSRWYGWNLGVDGSGQAFADACTNPPGGAAHCDDLFGPAVRDGKWHHIALVKDATVITLYVDGAAAATRATTDLPYYGGGGAAIGRDGDASTGYFPGSIDEVAVYNTPLSATRVRAHYSAANTYAAAVAVDVPLSYWRLGETSGATAADQAGLNPGTINGGVTRGQPGVTGAIGGDGAMAFDGSSGYVALGDSPTLKPEPTFTLEAWFKTSASFGDDRVILRSRYFGWWIGIDGAGHPVGDVCDGGGGLTLCTKLVGPAMTRDGRWHHIVLVKDITAAALYLDGFPQAAVTPSAPVLYLSPGGAAIGRDGDAAGSYFPGTIDEVAVYETPLSAARVTAHFAAATLTQPPTPPGNVSTTAGNAQAAVSWSPSSSDGGSPITSYTVTASPGGQTATACGSCTTTTVAGLTNGVTSTFTVRATNAVGNSSASAPSNAVTPSAPAGTPGAPINVSAIASTLQATITWTAPASNGGAPIDSYLVQAYTGAGYVGAISACGSCTEATYTGLSDGTTYGFAVYAHNATGYGPATWSNTVTPGVGGGGAGGGGCTVYNNVPSGCNNGAKMNASGSAWTGVYGRASVAQLNVPTVCGDAEYTNDFNCWRYAYYTCNGGSGANHSDFICGGNFRPIQLVLTHPYSAAQNGDFIGVGYVAGCARGGQNADPTYPDHCTGIHPTNGGVYKRMYVDTGFGPLHYYTINYYQAVSPGDVIEATIQPAFSSDTTNWYAAVKNVTTGEYSTFTTGHTEADWNAPVAKDRAVGFVSYGAEASNAGSIKLDMTEHDYVLMQTQPSPGAGFQNVTGYSSFLATTPCSGIFGANQFGYYITFGGSC